MQTIKGRLFYFDAVNKHFTRIALLNTSRALETVESTRILKSWKEIPGPPALPVLGPILQLLFKSKLEDYKGFKLFDIMYKSYGPIVKFEGSLGAPDFIMLFDPEAVEYVLRSENSMPIRPGFESLAYYRQKYKKNEEDSKRLTGLMSDQGENWKEFRSKVNHIMLQPKTIQLYTDVLEKVANDMIARLRSIRDENNMITNKLGMEMNLWALESVGVVALGTRLNCFDPNLPEDSLARKLIHNVHDLFKIPEKLDFGPSPWRYFSTPAFRKAMKIYEEQENLTKHFINQALTNMEESKKNSKNADSEKPILQKLLEVDVSIAHVMASDMLIAGVDTVANTVLATMYLLAINPEKQQKLREEVLSTPTQKSYLKACIKESMRMLPVVTGNARLSTKEYNLLGYKIPKGVLVTLSHQYMSTMEKYYPKPGEFIPERWLTNKDDPLYHRHTHPFVFSPFGFGVRMCIGRRIAELEMEIFISKVIENFQVDWNGEPIRVTTALINYIAEPFNFVFNDL